MLIMPRAVQLDPCRRPEHWHTLSPRRQQAGSPAANLSLGSGGREFPGYLFPHEGKLSALQRLTVLGLTHRVLEKHPQEERQCGRLPKEARPWSARFCGVSPHSDSLSW